MPYQTCRASSDFATRLSAAGAIGPAALRTLDAIHLASAAVLGDDLEAFVTYDRCLADAARVLGMPDVAPGA